MLRGENSGRKGAALVQKHAFSPELLRVLRRARLLAKEMGHSYVGTEHLMLALMQQSSLRAGKVLQHAGWEAQSFRGVLLAQTGTGSGSLPLVQGLSLRARLALQRAGREATLLRAETIEPEHLLLALSRDGECTASAILRASGTDLNCIFSDTYLILQRPAAVRANGGRIATRLLELYCENLLEKAPQMDPVIGREREIAGVMQVLSRKNKNNPALIGEPGVGKTAIVEALAQRMAAGQVPEPLRSKKLYALNMASMLAGTKYRGEFEERVRDILAEIKRSGNIILFVDEMHTIVGAGSAEGAIDAANLLKPALGRGELQMIGATTLEEYRKYIEKDAALERRFRPVRVPEPSRDETRRILQGLRPGLEQHHRIRISDEAVDAAVELSCRYLTDRFLPDKAVDLLDEGAARVWLASERGSSAEVENARRNVTQQLETAVSKGQYEQAAQLRDRLQAMLRQQVQHARAQRSLCVTAQDIALAVSERTGIPAGKLCASEKERLMGLERALSGRVIGQPEAVQAVTRAVIRGRSGLADSRRPAACMLFMGPTGVGKTELCKALADCVYGSREALVRIDMSEYMEPNSVARLIGAPPGYVGHDEGGTLTEKVRRRPYCVVLLDELEKAHRDVTGLLLQMMDDGILTDSLGRTVDFKNTMIVMTSNIGGGNENKGGLGFSPDGAQQRTKSLLRQYFSAEFLGRIDCVAEFRRLGPNELETIASSMMQSACERFARQSVTLGFDGMLAQCLAQRCLKDEAGARGLRHEIQRQIEEPAAELLLQKPSLRALRAQCEDGQIVIREAD